ncbi:MAG: hypothetical protein ACYC1U_06185 [Candidatus Aquicultorales bacterium]
MTFAVDGPVIVSWIAEVASTDVGSLVRGESRAFSATSIII